MKPAEIINQIKENTYSDYTQNKGNKINIYKLGTTKGPAPKAPEDQEDIIGGLKILE